MVCTEGALLEYLGTADEELGRLVHRCGRAAIEAVRYHWQVQSAAFSRRLSFLLDGSDSRMYSKEISKKEMDELGLFAIILGHVGDGNFHESILYDTTDRDEKERVRRCVRDMVHRAISMEGTCTVRNQLTPLASPRLVCQAATGRCQANPSGLG